MGGGSWSTNSHTARSSAKKLAGYATSFDHDEDIKRGRKAAGVHESLDPKSVNGEKSDRAGQNVRECMISDEHPDPTPIAVLFDVTGSMHSIPRVLQEKLPNLHGLLQRKGYVEDPQLLFGGIGDAFSDRVPLQIGQFESDNRGDENLESLFLEGGGGGGCHESYELAAYFMARHTYLEPYEKSGKKGYLFIIGDERVYGQVTPNQVRELIGGVSSEQSEPISTEAIFEELKERYHVFFLFAAQGSYRPEDVMEAGMATSPYLSSNKNVCYWKDLLGENALVLDDAAAVCETIALTLGVMEGTVTLEDGMEDLKEVGSDLSSITAAGKALATVGATGSTVAQTTGELPGIDEGEAGAERL